jgi:uncharacterized protein YgbK (DUF1537 family)
MISALAIADDFTGAAEIAGIGLRYGLPTRLLRAAPTRPHSGPGLTVLDTDSRDLTADDAARKVAQFVRHLRAADYQLIYKKTDSVLRGPVLAEVQSLLHALGRSTSLLVPQNPSRGRTVIEGIYMIEGMPLDTTTFAQDPEHPAKSARVLDLIGTSPLAHQPVRYLGPKESLRHTGVVMGGAANAKEIASWAAKSDERTLPAGGADFFRALLERDGLSATRKFETTLPGHGALFVNGSASAHAKELMRRAGSAGITVCPMPGAVYSGDAAGREAIVEWEEQVLAALKGDARAVATIGRPLDRVHGASGRLLTALVELAAHVLGKHRVAHVFADGGATASAVARKMTWNDFDVTGELASGVVRLRVSGSREQHLVVKPGSYTWPESVWSVST